MFFYVDVSAVLGCHQTFTCDFSTPDIFVTNSRGGNKIHWGYLWRVVRLQPPPHTLNLFTFIFYQQLKELPCTYMHKASNAEVRQKPVYLVESLFSWNERKRLDSMESSLLIGDQCWLISWVDHPYPWIYIPTTCYEDMNCLRCLINQTSNTRNDVSTDQ